MWSLIESTCKCIHVLHINDCPGTHHTFLVIFGSNVHIYTEKLHKFLVKVCETKLISNHLCDTISTWNCDLKQIIPIKTYCQYSQ